MTLLLDTQVLIWWLADDERLGPATRQRLDASRDPLSVSVASLWEAAIKHATGKLRGYDELRAAFGALPVTTLPVRAAHVDALVDLPMHHHDPFDRILIATAHAEGLALMSSDAAFAAYEVEVIDPRA